MRLQGFINQKPMPEFKTMNCKSNKKSLLSLLALAAFTGSALAAKDGPVKVYILAGQSNMVGIGQVTSGSVRWGDEFLNPVLSVYEGAYDSKADYDSLKPVQTLELPSFGGTEPTEFPKGGVRIVRGFIKPKETAVYQFNPGYGDSTHNIMVVNGVEAHRREPGGESVHKSVKLTAGEKVPFKITYLTDGANGLGWTVRLDTAGTLHTVVHEEKKFTYLIDKTGKWASRDDVWYKGVVTATADKWLGIGCGAGASQIGPELGFGHLVGDFHDEPVLLLKASQGNRSLAWDFLPPGSERYEVGDTVYAGYKDSQPSWKKGEEPQAGEWYAGKQYDDCFNAAKEVLRNFDASFPHWKGRGYEIAGFGWWQGHKDTGSGVHAARYEKNLVQLIKTLRRDFDAPQAKFVVAVGCGNEGREGTGLQIAEAQLAVDGGKGKYPEFKGNVITVETRDFWPDPEKSPKNQGFHYHQNAGTYMQVGEAMGKGMLELLKVE
jgi:alpha-galactosidase